MGIMRLLSVFMLVVVVCCTAYSEDCADSHQSCCFWAAADECKINPQWMATNCAQSCGTCGCSAADKSTCTVTLAAGCQLKESQVAVPKDADKNPQKSGATGDCVDQYKDCCGWQALGECDKNPFWMRVNCQAACGSCGCTIANALTCKLSSSGCAGAGAAGAAGGSAAADSDTATDDDSVDTATMSPEQVKEFTGPMVTECMMPIIKAHQTVDPSLLPPVTLEHAVQGVVGLPLMPKPEQHAVLHKEIDPHINKSYIGGVDSLTVLGGPDTADGALVIATDNDLLGAGHSWWNIVVIELLNGKFGVQKRAQGPIALPGGFQTSQLVRDPLPGEIKKGYCGFGNVQEGLSPEQQKVHKEVIADVIDPMTQAVGAGQTDKLQALHSKEAVMAIPGRPYRKYEDMNVYLDPELDALPNFDILAAQTEHCDVRVMGGGQWAVLATVQYGLFGNGNDWWHYLVVRKEDGKWKVVVRVYSPDRFADGVFDISKFKKVDSGVKSASSGY